MRDDVKDSHEDSRDEQTPAPQGIARRDALKAMAAAAMVPMLSDAAATAPLAPAARAPLPMLDEAQQAKRKGPRGTPSDPVLQVAKADWPNKLQRRELATLSALCDMIIPADAKSPAASAVGAPAYINEWASRPGGETSLVRVRGGLAWLDRESNTRFGARFHLATSAQRTAICDDICYLPKAKPEHKRMAQFFTRFRDLTSGGFYSTPEGWKDIGYVGNVAIEKFEGPTPAALKHLGLA